MDDILDIDGDHGFGILTRAAATSEQRPTLVLLNAGLIHRVGPFRMYVQIARQLAARGIDVFRFDLPRVGDAARNDSSAEIALQAVFDTLARSTGADRFVIGGICSAADLAWRVAQFDERVIGLWLFDGFARRGLWFRVGRARQAMSRPLSQWPALALRLLRRVRPSPGPEIEAIRDWPDPEQFRTQSATLLARGVRILATYTGGVRKYLLHARQLDSTFGPTRRHPGLLVQIWPGLDHTLMSPLDRQHILDSLETWATRLK